MILVAVEHQSLLKAFTLTHNLLYVRMDKI